MNFPFWNGLWATERNAQGHRRYNFNTAIIEAFADPAVQQRFRELGYDIPERARLTPGALAQYHREEVAKWHPIFKAANVKAE